MRNALLVAFIISIFLAGAAYAQSAQPTVRVQRGDYVVIEPLFSASAPVKMTCRNQQTGNFYTTDYLFPSRAIKMDLPGSLAGTSYTFSCYIEDNPVPPFSVLTSEQRTARVIVHECPGGYVWDPEIRNRDNTLGKCEKTQQDCSAINTAGNYVCYEGSGKKATDCILKDDSTKVCCSATSPNSIASYPYRDDILTSATGATICGQTYAPGAADGVCPRDLGSASDVIDPDCLYNGAAPDTRCAGKVPDVNYGGVVCDENGQVKDMTPPTQAVSAPTGWVRADFLIQVTESDPSGVACSYSSGAATYAGVSRQTKTDAERQCNQPLSVRLGGTESESYANCPYQGASACTFTIKTTDNSAQRNSVPTQISFSVDSIRPVVQRITPGQADRQFTATAVVNDVYPPGTTSPRAISGMKFVEINVLNSADAVMVSKRCDSEGAPSVTCATEPSTLAYGQYRIVIGGEDVAGNVISQQTGILGAPPACNTFTASTCPADRCQASGNSCTDKTTPPPACSTYSALTCPTDRCQASGNGCTDKTTPPPACNTFTASRCPTDRCQVSGNSCTILPDPCSTFSAPTCPADRCQVSGSGCRDIVILPVTVNNPPSVSSVSYTGDCKLNTPVMLNCQASDTDGNLASAKLWAGQCQAGNCFNTRSWETGSGTTYLNGESVSLSGSQGTASKTFTINQPIGTAIAATCQAYDSNGAESPWQDADEYNLCVVNGCANPPSFSNIQVSPEPVSSGLISIDLTSEKTLKDDGRPTVSITSGTQSVPQSSITVSSRNLNTFMYSARIPDGFPQGNAVISVSGADSDNCVGTSERIFSVDHCARVSCESIPESFCDGDDMVFYTSGGVCEVVDNRGVCQYTEFRERCGYGCFEGLCNENRAPSLTGVELFSLILP